MHRKPVKRCQNRGDMIHLTGFGKKVRSSMLKGLKVSLTEVNDHCNV